MCGRIPANFYFNFFKFKFFRKIQIPLCEPNSSISVIIHKLFEYLFVSIKIFKNTMYTKGSKWMMLLVLNYFRQFDKDMLFIFKCVDHAHNRPS